MKSVHSMILSVALSVAMPYTASAQSSASPESEVSTPPVARAHASSGDKSGASLKSGTIDEVIVTAQRREEPLQAVPIAITVLDSGDLQATGVHSVADLQFAVPGLENTSQAGTLTLRGVGSQNVTTIGGEPGVSVYVDGHYMAAQSFVVYDLLDVQRVEAQRGPQGTLYGRNATGGNLSIVSNRPTDELTGTVSVDIGSYDKHRLEGVLSGPLNDRVRGRLAVAREKRDGYTDNTVGRDVPDSDYINSRALLDIDLTDGLMMSLGAYYIDDSSVRNVRQFLTDPSPDVINQDGPFDRGDIARGVSVDFSWNLGNVEFKSLSAYSDENYRSINDLDATPIYGGFVSSEGDMRTISQEFQLLSAGKSPLSWVAGLYLFDQKQNFTFRLDNAPTLLLRSGPANVNARSIAGYFQAQYAVNDQLEFVAGVRQTHDYKDMTTVSSFLVLNGSVISPAIPQAHIDDSWNVPTWRLGVNYHFSPDVMWYASWARGFKAGGYNYTNLNSPAYDPEYVTSLESGIKGEWLNSALLTNLTGFYYDYADKQERAIVSLSQGSNYIVNAASAEIYGVELETVWRPLKGLRFDLTLGYQEGQYENFHLFVGGSPRDLAGNKTTNTPRLKYAVGAEHEMEIGSAGSLTYRVVYSHTDERFANYFNSATQPSYERLNALVRWESPKNWSAEAYVENSQDKRDYIFTDPAAGEIYYLAPRTYGLRLNYRF